MAAGATPSDVMNAIDNWGLWGQLLESSQSSANGSRVLNASNDVMLSLLHSVPLTVTPNRLTLRPDNLGPNDFVVQLFQVQDSHKHSRNSKGFPCLQSCFQAPAD